MSKHNVNPDHYKVAGRERQGEEILQARNKQKLAQSVVRERFEKRQAVPAATSPADPSTFLSAPSVASARQESGSTGETPREPGDDGSSRRAKASPRSRPTATARSAKAASSVKERSASSTKTRGTTAKTRRRTAAKKSSRGGAKSSASRPKSSGGKKRAAEVASRKRATGKR